MTRVADTLRSIGVVGWLLIRAGLGSVRSSWGLALFSIGAALAVWVVVQDVENPRETAQYPPEGESPNIVVEPRNLPEGYLLLSPPLVSVTVEARADDIPDLRASDFHATIDLLGAPTTGEPTSRRVHVESRRDGVDILSVSPAEVDVALVQAATRSLDVGVRVVGPLPAGFRVVDQEITPGAVEVYGVRSVVESIESVVLDVNLSGVRTQSYQVESELTARNRSGNALNVRFFVDGRQVSRGTATFDIEQTAVQRTMFMDPTITGAPAPGYYVAGWALDPPRVNVTGASDVLESLTGNLTLEAIDITKATGKVEATVAIKTPQNVQLEAGRSSVRISVFVEPIRCREDVEPCATETRVLAPQFVGTPSGLTVAPGTYRVTVYVQGALPDLSEAGQEDFRAVVDLSAGTLGARTYTPTVTGPPGITVVGVEPVLVTLTGGGP